MRKPTKVELPKEKRSKRKLSEAEEKARQECGGLTRREWRQKHSKFLHPKGRSGSFEVQALFDGNPVVQTAPFPNNLAAIARFERLSTNPNVSVVKVVENQTIRGANGEAVALKQVTLFSLEKRGQEFANSKITTIYRNPGDNALLTMKAIKASERLTTALFSNKLEVVKYQAEGGEAWWERRA